VKVDTRDEVPALWETECAKSPTQSAQIGEDLEIYASRMHLYALQRPTINVERLVLMLAIADFKLAGDGGKDWACGTVVQLRQRSENRLRCHISGSFDRGISDCGQDDILRRLDCTLVARS
jgi:hypothetical protein